MLFLAFAVCIQGNSKAFRYIMMYENKLFTVYFNATMTFIRIVKIQKSMLAVECRVQSICHSFKGSHKKVRLCTEKLFAFNFIAMFQIS